MAQKRKYELKARAARQEETRRRITEATVALHLEVGPAKTTISEVAKRAGVQRLTVYNNFPDEGSLFAACSAHWNAQHPPPDPATWMALEQPLERVRAALGALYPYYREVAPMTGKVIRDADSLPALRELLDETFEPFLAWLRDDLAGAFGGDPGERLRAALGLAVRFETWSLLTERQGLADDAAAELMLDLVGAASPTP